MGLFRCFFVGILCVVIFLSNIMVSFATKGPCGTVHNQDFIGAIGCDSSGACIGLRIVIPYYVTCSDVNENDCANDIPVTQDLYNPSTVIDNSWSAWLACVGGNIACGTCVATAAGSGLLSAGTLTVILSGVCAVVCGAIGSIDPCCRVTCTSTISPSHPPYGNSCIDY
jgi:hypothetical protein